MRPYETRAYTARIITPRWDDSDIDRRDRHMQALANPLPLTERPLVGLLKAWALYADTHRVRYDRSLCYDATGPAWAQMGASIHALFAGEKGRLDGVTVGAFVRDTLRAEGFEAEEVL